MRTPILVLAALAACAEPVDATLDGNDAELLEGPSEMMPAPPDFSLSATNFSAGFPATLTITGAAPNRLVRIAYGSGLGAGPCLPQLGGECLDVLGPISLLPFQGTTNGQGTLVFTLQIPSNLANDYLGLQAVVAGGNVNVSNPVGRRVIPAGQAIPQNSDFDFDGFTPAQGDCDDFDPTVNPDGFDVFGDGEDRNCDNADGVDADQDGFSRDLECDDRDDAIYPGAPEVCNGVDDNCNGLVDDGLQCEVTETFDAGGANSDVLFVIDDSCSMVEEQANLALFAPFFIDPILATGLDPHVGVVTTDMANQARQGRLRQLQTGDRYVDAASADPARDLSELVTAGTAGDFVERGIDASFAALTPPIRDNENAGFLREDADLHVIYVSDEANQSQTLSPPGMVSFLNNLKTPDYSAIAHAIVGPPMGCQGPGGSASAGFGYLLVQDLTGGFFQPICDPTFETVLLAVQGEIVQRAPQSSFELAEDALPNTIIVRVTPPGGMTMEVDADYDPMSGTVTIDPVAPGSTVEIEYIPAP